MDEYIASGLRGSLAGGGLGLLIGHTIEEDLKRKLLYGLLGAMAGFPTGVITARVLDTEKEPLFPKVRNTLVDVGLGAGAGVLAYKAAPPGHWKFWGPLAAAMLAKTIGRMLPGISLLYSG